MNNESARKFFSEVEARARRDVTKWPSYPEIMEDFERAVESPIWKCITVLDVALLLKKQDTLCRKCGECCRRNNPILLSRSEVAVIAKYLGIPYKKLKKRLKLIPAQPQGHFHMPAGPCPFLKRNRCSIYPVRPEVCRFFPVGKIVQELELIDEGRKQRIEFFPTYCNVLKELFVRKLEGLTLRYYMERKRPDLLTTFNAFMQNMVKDIGGGKPLSEMLRERIAQLERYEKFLKIVGLGDDSVRTQT
jgi:Fe-S-cluster containining protein